MNRIITVALCLLVLSACGEKKAEPLQLEQKAQETMKDKEIREKAKAAVAARPKFKENNKELEKKLGINQ